MTALNVGALRVLFEAAEHLERMRPAFEKLKEDIAVLERAATFDGKVRILEDACKFELGQAEGGPLLVENPPEPGAVPEQESPGWCAVEILTNIERVRRHIANGEASKAAAVAMTIGERWAELDARFDWPETQAWRAHRAAQSRRSVDGNRTKRDNAIGRRRIIELVLLPDYRDEFGKRDRPRGHLVNWLREHRELQKSDGGRWSRSTIYEDLKEG